MSVKASKIMLTMTLTLLLIVSVAIIYILITDHNKEKITHIQIETYDIPLGLPENPEYYDID